MNKLGMLVNMWFGRTERILQLVATKLALDDFAKKWEGKYSYAVKSWRDHWEELTVFFDFPLEIRKIIYTTNLIENLNGKIRNAKHS